MPSMIGQRKGLKLERLSAKQLRDAEVDKVYIYNVSPMEHRVPGMKIYVIPACEPGEPYSRPLVIPGMEYMTKARKGGLNPEMEWHSDDGIDVARAIIGVAGFQDVSQDLSTMGVFISQTMIPDGIEVETANARWFEWCSAKVEEAKVLYSINKGITILRNGKAVSEIGKQHRIAAEALGLSASLEWAAKTMAMMPCPECATPNVSTAARCKECRCVFNEELCRQRFPEMFAHERKSRVKQEEAA